MFKRFTLFFVCLACAGMLSAQTYSNVKIGELYYNLWDYYTYWENDQHKQDYYYAEVTNNPDTYSGKVVVPGSVVYNGQQYAVKAIRDGAFAGCPITSVELSIGIERINSQVFYNSSLSSIIISESVKRIGWNAFHNCTNLTEITIPSSVTYIDSYAFQGCSSLANVNISNPNTSFGENVFSGTAISTPMIIGSTLVYVPTTIEGEYIIPNTITSIAGGAFKGCSKLIAITIPNSVKNIGNNTFYDCSSLTSVTLPNSILSIGNYAFYKCSSLTSITLPNSVTNIGYEVFYGCGNLEQPVYNSTIFAYMPRSFVGSYIVPDGIKTIANRAFSDCKRLKSVQLPNGLIDILSSSFNYCDSLTSVNIPNSVTNIGSSAFYGCSRLDSISIPNSVTSLDWHSFAGCTGLKYVKLSCNLAEIPSYCFERCGFESIRIPAGITTIRESAFAYCPNLNQVVLSRTLQRIENDAFAKEDSYNSTYITYIINKSCLPIVGGSTEYGQVALHATYIESNDYTDICNDGFCFEVNENDTILVSISTSSSEVSLPTQIRDNNWNYNTSRYSVANGAFSTYSYNKDDTYNPISESTNGYVNKLIIPNNVTAIGDLHSIPYVQEIIFKPESPIKSIGENIFSGSYTYPCSYGSTCSNSYQLHYLKTVVLPDHLERIEEGVFDGCSNLTTITLPQTLTYIGQYAFRGTALTSVTIPDGVKDVTNVFYDCSRMQEYIVSETHPTFSTMDGLLLNKSKTKLIAYPAGKVADYYMDLPSSVDTIGDFALSGGSMMRLNIPLNIKYIGQYNKSPQYYVFEAATPPVIHTNAFDGNNGWLLVPDTTAYKTAWPQYASRIHYKGDAIRSINVDARSDRSSVHVAIGDKQLEGVLELTISGSINSYDLMIMRNKMINLKVLDIKDAQVQANEYQYYTGYSSEDNVLRNHSFKNLIAIKLPSSLSLADSTFTECTGLRYLEFNGGVVGTSMVPSSNLIVRLNEGVTSIQAGAFASRSGLKNIYLPSSLGKIDNSLFANCSGLSKVIISDDISSIGNSAFEGCSSLKQIHLPEHLEEIGNNAFAATSLEEISIPASVVTIGNNAFKLDSRTSSYGNSNYVNYFWQWSYNNKNELTSQYISYGTPTIKKIHFAKNAQLKSIGNYAFAMCDVDSIIFPDSVSTIGEYAFLGCKALKYVSFSDNSKLTVLNKGVFQQCNALDSIHLPKSLLRIGEVSLCTTGALKLIIPEAVTTIQQGAFYDSRLTSIKFPTTLKDIKKDAFKQCSNIDSLSFPTSLQTIGDYAFYGCSGLKELRVPSTLLSVGNYAFYNCSNVKKVYTYTVEPVSINQQTFSCWHNADLYVPMTSFYTYYYNTQWSQFLSLKEFDEPYTYFYINNDYELGDGTGTIEGNPDADLNENSGLIVTGDEQQGLGVITIMGDGVNAGSIIACEENLSADSLIIRILTQKGKWNYFCFPFDMLLEQLHFAHQYAIREYDGATRAQYGAGGWINMVGDMIHAGLGYIFQGAQTDTLEIVVPNPKISCQDYEQIIQAFNSDDAVHANWNFIGNPYPSWYDLDFLFAGGFSSPIYIWNASIQDYQVYKPGDDEYHFHPYEGFFTQNPGSTDMHIIWGSDGRETKTQADDKQHGHHMPRKAARVARQQNDNRKLINLQLASESYTDRTRIVFNDAARMEYELGKDAVVMDGGQAPLHIWSLNDDKRLSINERPYATGQVSLGYYVKEDGFYTLSASRMDTAVVIFDNELNQEVDLAAGDYVFYTDAGTNNTRFSIIRIKEQTEQTTAIEDVVNADEPVTVYTLLGAKLYDNVRRADLHLNAGVYIIEKKDGARTELTIQ